ncbi:hypothetical protein HYH43_07205 [Clostridium botulinum]|nr:hypothetical protein [Clostridium botulinum]MBY6789225.1 hypothetical protein [Clostridium botulinum]MBY6946574.1 hypothetical protein [Clostridium botulinum]MBY7020202.1 hypothetical protein [Clostridium botulinum]
MKKNEILKEIDNKIKFIKNQKGTLESYQIGMIYGLKLAKETVKEFKRGK